MKLEAFLDQTENVKADLVMNLPHTKIEYPFLYVERFTNVELRQMVSSGTLHGTVETPDDIALYLKTEGYRFLGYVTLNFNTFIHINYLHEHEIILKTSKEVARPFSGSLVDALLLT